MPRVQALLLIALLLAPGARSALAGDGPAASAAVAAPRDNTLAYLEGLPETNPYRAVLLRLHTLPATDRDALKAWSNGNQGKNEPAPSLTTEQQALAREFAADLVSLSARPPTHAEDWPVLRDPADPDNPISMLVPGIGLARDLARIAVKTGDTLPPEEAVAIYAATAQQGRQQRGGASLIEQLVGVAIENTAFAAAGRRLSEYSAADLQKLSAAWSALQPQPDNARAFAGERELFFTPIVNNIIRPGLAAILAEDAKTGESPATEDEDPDAGFTRHLRLSGLADLGNGERRISLENTATGLTFTIAEGKSTEGIELVSLDFKTHEAVIRRGSCEAVIHLESKRIVEREPGRERAAAVARLRKMFTASAGMPDAEGEKLLNTTVERARRHPGGADGYADELLDTYQRFFDAQLAAADSPEVPANPPAPPESDDPLIKLMVPSLGRVGRTFNGSATSPTVLQAAIHHRLTELGAASPGAAPADPWNADGSPFGYEATPDGGFLLRSCYELDSGKPLTYKFAAPDAGLVRKK